MTVDCPFCTASAERVLFADRDVLAIWDGFPVTEGHLLLVPRRHVSRWANLAKTEIDALTQAISEAQTRLQLRFGVDQFNVGFNDGPAAGQTVAHFHIHVIPRRVGDSPDPRGGVRHVIPTKGNYLQQVESRNTVSRTPHTRTLIAGGEDALLRHLLPHIDDAIAVDVAEYLTRLETYDEPPESLPATAGEKPPIEFTDGPILWREYMREEIPPLFGHRFSTARWNQGFLIQGSDVFLLATLEKGDMPTQYRYSDRFLDASHFQWHSQNRTKRDAAHGRVISGANHTIHLFVRASKKRPNGKAAPFIYCGQVQFESWTGDKPIEVVWRLPEPLPEHLHRILLD